MPDLRWFRFSVTSIYTRLGTYNAVHTHGIADTLGIRYLIYAWVDPRERATCI